MKSHSISFELNWYKKNSQGSYVLWGVILTEANICQETEKTPNPLPELCFLFTLLFYIKNQQIMKSRHKVIKGLICSEYKFVFLTFHSNFSNLQYLQLFQNTFMLKE